MTKIVPGASLGGAPVIHTAVNQAGQDLRFTFNVLGPEVGQVIAAQLVVSPWTIVTPGFSILGPGGSPLFSGTLTATTIRTGRLTADGHYTVLINPALARTWRSGTLEVAVCTSAANC